MQDYLPLKGLWWRRFVCGAVLLSVLCGFVLIPAAPAFHTAFGFGPERPVVDLGGCCAP